MNLHDILSQESGHVVYVPTHLTVLQRDLCEALVQMFAPTLAVQVEAPPRASISLLLTSEPQWVHPVGLLFDELAAVCRHALLVVDHFVPRRLLLLEVTQRLTALSGKLGVFNLLVDHAVERFERAPPATDFTVLVVAESVKELEWIEGVVVGKKLRYTNASGRRLYDAPEPVPPTEVEDDVPDVRGCRARSRLVAQARAARARATPAQVVLHLVTTHQAAAAAGAAAPNIVFSFDAGIEPASVTCGAHGRVPVVVPVPVFSLEHLVHVMPPPVAVDGTRARTPEWKLAVVKAFVANRFRLFELGVDRTPVLLVPWALDWATEAVPEAALLAPFTDALSWDKDHMAERLHENHLESLAHLFAEARADSNDSNVVAGGFHLWGSPPTDYRLCKLALAQFLHARIAQIDHLLDTGYSQVLPAMRATEAARQLEIDMDEERVATNFRKLRRLNESATVVERKLARAESEHARAAAAEKETRDMAAHLAAVVAGDADVDPIVAEQAQVLRDLESECSRLTAEHERLASDGEALRAQYQATSSEAVQATGAVGAAKAQQAQLEQRLQGPGMTVLPRLVREDERAQLGHRLEQLAGENAFLALFLAQRLEKIVRERSAVVEATSLGSSSRATNRISRASTPLM